VKRFEDMIQDPVGFAKKCLEQTNNDLALNLRQVKKWAARVQNRNNKSFLEAACSRPYSRNDHSKKVGRWQENLTPAEVDLVLPIVIAGSKLFGYDL
jgi:hypothetical protein